MIRKKQIANLNCVFSEALSKDCHAKKNRIVHVVSENVFRFQELYT